MCPLSVLERVRIIEGFLEEMYENFVGTYIGNCQCANDLLIAIIYIAIYPTSVWMSCVQLLKKNKKFAIIVFLV